MVFDILNITLLRKLYFIANAEVVQGMDNTEPVKVDSDKKVSVAETFENIWEFFEQKEPLTEKPPKSWLYQPLLIPLIGTGVANERYTDLEIFSKLVDLYYKHLRKSIRQGTPSAIPRMIINIQNKTAIKNDTSSKTQGRKYDITVIIDVEPQSFKFPDISSISFIFQAIKSCLFQNEPYCPWSYVINS